MLRSLWLLFLYLAFLGLTTSAPFAATLGYVWVDTFQPQLVSYILLNQMPVAMIMGAVAFFSYVLMDRRSPPRIPSEMALHIALAIWVNMTMLWAVAPQASWDKWDWAFKTLAFTAFIPLVIRSRVQIEAFVQTYLFSLAANIVPFGIKTLISGGGYGVNLGLIQGNGGLAEGGELSTLCLMAVPLALYLAKYNRLLPKFKLLPLGYWFIAGLAVATAIGTYERSALVGLAVLGLYLWVQSKHKFAFGLVAAIAAILVIYTTSHAWNARIDTIGHFETEGSAYTRILVWRWTLEFAATHPFGGGFQAYLVNHINLPGFGGGAPTIEFGRAFHSIYFEMLGEQGYPGLIMFLLISTITFVKLRRLARKVGDDPELQWIPALSTALQSGLAVFLTSGAFVGIAFQPMYWYFIATSISLNAYVSRLENQTSSPERRWKGMVAGITNNSPLNPAAPGWRNRASRPQIDIAAR